MKKRTAKLERKTKETDIRVDLVIDGSGKSRVKTGMPFLDHMIEALAKHGLFDINLSAKGDLHVDTHHTNEDVAIALGMAFKNALGDKKSIKRFADFRAPLDEALTGVRVSLDLSGRGSAHFHTGPKTRWIENRAIAAASNTMNYNFMDMKHFLESLAAHLGMTLHVDFIAGEQPHHIIEATFKALAKALLTATSTEERAKGIPSTKGRL